MKTKSVIITLLIAGSLIYIIWANNTGHPGLSGITNNNAVPSQFGALNPAHGQPGHRCDIAVGAPLSSNNAPVSSTNMPAVPSAQPSPQVTMNPASSVPAAAPGANAKMNPAHGQPGHRCDIAVGAPLPATNTAATNTAPTTTNSQIFTPQPSAGQTTAVPTGPKPKVNPAHGLPWHRCDLQVGAPLT